MEREAVVAQILEPCISKFVFQCCHTDQIVASINQLLAGILGTWNGGDRAPKCIVEIGAEMRQLIVL
jgi:hypothetical protein